EISNVANNANSGTLTPTLSQRKVKSTIAVTSGQTVLLAGLISETQNRTRTGIPLLDSIPGVGDAFTTQNGKGIQRTELIIFIRRAGGVSSGAAGMLSGRRQSGADGAEAAVGAAQLRSEMRGAKLGSTNPPGAVVPRAPQVVR